MAPTVFFIGLGNMGWGMAKNVVEKAGLDQPLLVYNRSKDRAVAFSKDVPAGKVTVIDSVAEGVARADIVWTMLADDPAIEAVYEQALGGGDGAAKGKLLIESSTVHPDTTTKLEAAARKHGAEFVAAPVFGAPAMATSGQLIGVLAGPAAAVERARFLFEGVTSRAEILMKDEPVAHALTLKLIGNTFILNMIEQVAEGHVLAETSGLGTAHVHRYIELMFPGPYAAYSQRMLSGSYYTLDRPLFAVDLARKDLRHALALAAASGAKLPNTETADAHLVKVKEHDGERGDVAAIYGAVRQEAGLPYENQAKK